MKLANPVLARGLAIDLDVWALAARLLFWAGMALLLVPFLEHDLPELLRLATDGCGTSCCTGPSALNLRSSWRRG
ncbi:hypothetical protein [Rhodobacter viridis]|uniref:hypothetical protein n=1 Tax=Rhodobacter viridis TaxID=1054202 RepID=UPI0015E8AF9B|nr:hypothetical protein [Rhodobacter viridis]